VLMLAPAVLEAVINSNIYRSILEGFGDGSDGVLRSGGTINIDREDEQTLVLQYSEIDLQAGEILNFGKRMRGVIMLCQGDCTIAGTIDLSGKCAKVSKDSTEQMNLQIPVGTIIYNVPAGGNGGNGGAGGKGGINNTTGLTTSGGAGGSAGLGTSGTWFGGGWGGAGGGGGSSFGYSGTFTGGNAGGSGGNNNLDYPAPTLPGSLLSGGSGGQGPYSTGSGGGGGAGWVAGLGGYATYGVGEAGGNGDAGPCAGGCSLILIVRGDLIIKPTGLVKSNGLSGGNGGNGGRAYNGTPDVQVGGAGGGGGQGGSGGGVIVLARRGTFFNEGTIQVNGGTGGSRGLGATTRINGQSLPAEQCGLNGGNGSAGSAGSIIVLSI
jgi:hypothetical protein